MANIISIIFIVIIISELCEAQSKNMKHCVTNVMSIIFYYYIIVIQVSEHKYKTVCMTNVNSIIIFYYYYYYYHLYMTKTLRLLVCLLVCN